jgi:hypothetical protein
MSIWGDIKGAAEAVPGISTVPAIGSAIGDVVQGHLGQASKDISTAIPGVGIAQQLQRYDPSGNAIYKALGGDTGSSTPASSDVSQANQILSGLKYGQTNNPNSQLLTQLYGLMQNMTPAQANSLLGGGALKGTTLASELGQVATGDPVSQVLQAHEASVNPNYANQQNTQWSDQVAQALGQLFTKTIDPTVKSLNATGAAQGASDISAMQDALKGSSAQTQAAFKGIPEELQAAQSLANQANNTAISSGPEFSTLLNALTSQTGAYNAAKAAYALAPYYSQITQSGTVPQNIGDALAAGLLLPPTLGSTGG